MGGASVTETTDYFSNVLQFQRNSVDLNAFNITF